MIMKKKNVDNWIDVLLKAVDGQNPPMPDNELLWNAVQILTAGHETTASSLAWTTYFLSTHPATQDRLYQEIQTVLGSRKIPTHEDLNQFEYLTACIKESLLIEPVLNAFRVAKEMDTYQDYLIPKGTTVITQNYVIGRTKQYWLDPDGDESDEAILKYKPERFFHKGRAGDATHKAAWIPFGLGSRGCVGARLAMMEMKIILSMLVHKYKLSYPDYLPKPQTISLFTMKPTIPIHVKLTPRN